jgi:hypothetical protein
VGDFSDAVSPATSASPIDITPSTDKEQHKDEFTALEKEEK